MNRALVHPILEDADWNRSASFNVQVVPHNRRPGDFLARIIVEHPTNSQAGRHRLFAQIEQCGEISELHVFIESEQAGEQPVALAQSQEAALLPAVISGAFAPARFPNGRHCFLIRPGQTPPEPVYPVWTRDPKRSQQVVAGKYGEVSPASFEFIPTLNCIYRCHECAYRVPKESMGVWRKNNFAAEFHMDLPAMRALLDKLSTAGADEVLFTGGGEPLLNSATPAAMAYATEIGIARVGLYTNGAFITTPEKAHALLAAKPAYIRVSLNAGTAAVHHRHHNPLDKTVDYFNQTLAGIKYLAKAKQASASHTTLGVSYLVDRGNANDVTRAARHVTETAAPYPDMINYMRFTPSVNYFGPKQHEEQMFEKAVTRIVNEAVPILHEAGIEAPVYRHRFQGLYEPRTYTQCLAAGWYGGVGPGGIVYWCCEKLFNPDFAFGSLLDKTLAEIWAGSKRKVVARHVGEAVRGGTCSPCPVVCKPHEHNKVFAQVERLRAAGKIPVVATWLRQIHKIIQRQPEAPQPFAFDSKSDRQH